MERAVPVAPPSPSARTLVGETEALGHGLAEPPAPPMDGEAERVPPPPPPLPPAAEALGRPEKETEGVVLYDREGLEVVVGQAQGEGVTLGEGESEGEKEGETVREAEKEGRAVRLGEVECNGVREMGALLLGVRETVGQCEAVSQGEALGVSFGEEEGDWHAVGERL